MCTSVRGCILRCVCLHACVSGCECVCVCVCACVCARARAFVRGGGGACMGVFGCRWENMIFLMWVYV